MAIGGDTWHFQGVEAGCSSCRAVDCIPVLPDMLHGHLTHRHVPDKLTNGDCLGR